MVEGSAHAQQYFQGIYGCQLGEDAETGLVSDIKRCVTFTEKTRFLFEINKGITARESSVSPFAVNLLVSEDNRPVPLKHMIYIGDGLTDVPCFSVIENGGGMAFGVFQPGAESAKQAFQRLLETRRVRALYSPDYRDDADLGSMLRAAIEAMCTKITIARAQRP